jgi:cytochrome P450
MRDERYFDRADEFIPERWREQPELVKDRRAYFPFSMGLCPGTPKVIIELIGNAGEYVCPGRPLGMMSLRMFLSRTCLSFDWELAPGQTLEGYLEGMMSMFATQLPPTYIKFTPRKR